VSCARPCFTLRSVIRTRIPAGALALVVTAVTILHAPLPVRAEARPRVVLLANASGTETTDLLVPFAVLHDAGVADVTILAIGGDGPIALMPGLTILADATLHGDVPPADVVVVPAMHDPKEPALLAAVRAFAARGALVTSICDGAWVLAYAGLLEGHAATSHWYSIASLRSTFPRTTWRQDVRWVREGRVLTAAGLSAAVPFSRHLVDIIRDGSFRGDARDVGPAHDGARFAIAAGDVAIGARNYLLPWRHDVVAVPIADGVDELALGVALDLLDRTYAVRTTTFARGRITSRRGLRIVPDLASSTAPASANRVATIDASDFDTLLADIERRYGAATRNLVALQIEYSPRRD
jgi:putative intracellular protease/amidase